MEKHGLAFLVGGIAAHSLTKEFESGSEEFGSVGGCEAEQRTDDWSWSGSLEAFYL